MPSVSGNVLEDFAVELLAAGGTTREEAQIVGKSLVSANLRGYESHGVMRLPFYLDMLKCGDIVSRAEFTVINESSTRLAASANWGFGRVQTGELVARLIDKAEADGIGVGTLYAASHAGRLGEYCEWAADRGLVSMMMVNTHGAARRVAPPGGRASRLGTNPIAIGAPHATTPLILDFSTSATAEGKVRVKHIAGETCPDGWLIDSEGNPTNDPSSLYADPPGCILPMGGTQAYKGFGLALMIDILTGALSGGLCARETPESPKGNCVFALILNPEHFGGAAHFQQEVEQLVGFVRECPTTAGVEGITLPGDPERRVLADRTANGISLDAENWHKLVQLAENLGVAVPTVE